MPLTASAEKVRARLGILSCSNFIAELKACVQAEGWDDVVCAPLPARCGRPPLSWDEIRDALPAGTTHAVVLGRACLAQLGEPPKSFVPTELLVQEQCFHLLAGPSQVAQAVAQHSYLMSPGWLHNWRQELEKMGFAPSMAAEFFHDFAKDLVLLDSKLDPSSAQHLQEMAQCVGLPTKTIEVGLDHTRLLLKSWVLQWRLQVAQLTALALQQQYAKSLADHVTALDLLGQLTRRGNEDDVIAGMEDMFRMLFAPTVYHYLPNTDAGAEGWKQEVRQMLPTTGHAYAWTPTRSGFVLHLVREMQSLGCIYMDEFQFPAFKEQYLNLALAMIDVCDLSIESARNRKRLIEAEKMASLGTMVAGVAHEINTPVGVGTLATSTLQRQTRELAKRFSERSMTQSDLHGYLDSATEGAELIASSLARVGKLIASFRRVAVNGHRQNIQAIELGVSLQDAITSFGDRLQKVPFQVQVQCPPAITLQCYPGDLESVFTNLIANSLQHGFKGRAQGNISISVQQQGDRVRMVYADDGNGLSEEARVRIFDPFFTTDMQSGMGLGMHLVYNLITHRMGGSISVDLQVPSGVRFLMEIPTPAV